MKIEAKMIFPAVLIALLSALPAARAASANATMPMNTNPAAAGANTNVNLNTTMTQLFGDPVIAKGKDFEIKQSQLDAALLNIKTAAAARGQTIPPARMNMFKLGALDQLIDRQLLLQKATAADKAEGRHDFEKSLQELKTALKLTDAEFDQKLNQQLQLKNMTKEEWRQENIDQATALDVLKRELNVKVTEAEAKNFYDEHPADFERPEEVRFARIFMSTRDSTTGAELSDAEKASKKKQMEEVLKRARAGDNFTNLVQKYSEDPSVQENDGVYTIARGQTPPGFEAVAFSLNTNQISDIITTAGGYNIIKLLEKIPAKTEPFAGADTKIAGALDLTIRDALTAQTIQAKAPQYLVGLRKAADVTILDPDLKQLQSEADANAETNAMPSVK